MVNPYIPHPTLNSPPQPPPQQLTSTQGTIFGVIDGINANFYWQVFFPLIQVFVNQGLQISGVDYGAGPTAITFFPASIPQPGSTITILGFGTI